MFYRYNAKNSGIRLERRRNLFKVLRLSTTGRLLRQKTTNNENCEDYCDTHHLYTVSSHHDLLSMHHIFYSK